MYFIEVNWHVREHVIAKASALEGKLELNEDETWEDDELRAWLEWLASDGSVSQGGVVC